MLNSLHCRLPDLEGDAYNNSLKRSFEGDEDALTDMKRRVERLQKIMNLQRPTTKGHPESEQARALLYSRMQKTQELLGQINVTPTPSKRSATYKFFLELKRRGRGRVDEALASIEAERRLQIVDAKALEFKKAYNLTDHELGLAKAWSAEVGWQPYIADYDSVGSNGYLYMKSEQQRLYKYLKDELKFSDEDVQKFVESMSEVPKVYHEALLIGNDMGLNVEDLGEIGLKFGYFPRQFSKDFKRRMVWKWNDDLSNAMIGDDIIPIQRAFEKSRESWEYIVQDEVV
jgi:hypothetical protein